MKKEQKKELTNFLSLDLENEALEIAKSYAKAQGISFDLAVNELILRGAKQLEWMGRRQEPTPECQARALAVLNKLTGIPPEPDDRLPEGFEDLAK